MIIRDWSSAWPSSWTASGEKRAFPSLAITLTNVTLVALTILGLGVRVWAAARQPLFIDEPFTLLGIEGTAAHGVPILPTGILYLHGSTLSYLLAPLFALGWVHGTDLTSLRLISAVAGAASIVLSFRLAMRIGGSSVAALVAAAFVALDPGSVQWGGYLRMYALAQTISLVVVLLFLTTIGVGAVDGQPRRRIYVGLVLAFWLAVFTHLATAILLPPMMLVAVFVFGKDLVRTQRALSAAFVACLAAPVTLIALTGAITPDAGTKLTQRAEGIPGLSFLGDDKINFAQMVNPDPAVWASLFEPGPLEYLLPLIVTAASAILLFACVVQPADQSRSFRSSRGMLALLALYWMPILTLAFLAGDTSTRYGLFLAPFGWVLLSEGIFAAVWLVSSRLVTISWTTTRRALLAVALASIVLAHDAVGVGQVIQLASSGKRDLAASLRYVASRREPGDWVISVLPPPMAEYVLRSEERLAFLPGGEASTRTLRYTRQGPDGQPVDYWLGIPTLPTTASFCSFLAENPRSWLVMPKIYWRSWGYRGGSQSRTNRLAEEMRSVVTGVSNHEFEDRQAMVFRVNASSTWSADASAYCEKAVNRQERRSRTDD